MSPGQGLAACLRAAICNWPSALYKQPDACTSSTRHPQTRIIQELLREQGANRVFVRSPRGRVDGRRARQLLAQRAALSQSA